MKQEDNAMRQTHTTMKPRHSGMRARHGIVICETSPTDHLQFDTHFSS